MDTIENMLGKSYCADAFRKTGYQVIDMIADQLRISQSEKPDKTITWMSPENSTNSGRRILILKRARI